MVVSPLTPVTLMYVSVLGLLYMFLLRLVVKLRHEHRVAHGDGGNHQLRRGIQAHSNFAQYVPMLLLFLLLGEINHLPSWMLHVYGCLIIMTRLSHIYGLVRGENQQPPSYKGRFYGTLGTWILYVSASLSALLWVVWAT